MSKNQKTLTPETIAAARQASEVVAERMADIVAATQAIQKPELLNAIQKSQENFQKNNEVFRHLSESFNQIAKQLNDPLQELRLTIERATSPLTETTIEIGRQLSQFSANTAYVQSLSASTQQLQNVSAALTGKNSEFQALVRALGKSKDVVGIEPLKIANESKSIIEKNNARVREELEVAALTEALQSDKLDMTLPAPESPRGTVHPVSQVMDELAEIFADMGFAVAEGPEIEDDWHNFSALNIPETHPARAMHDTFYFPDQMARDGKKMLLRTHTSPVQIRTMTSQEPPIRIIAPGRVYRSDSDATHTPMFHQIEGLVIDKGIHLGHLKWTLETFLKAFFERDDVVLRLRPSYFPFTEPSVEVDVGYSVVKGKRVIGGNEGWMEVLGSGMVHRKVIEACGLDPDVWQGFAFGTGVDRLAMLKYGMDDLRAFFDGDNRWLQHYGFNALDVPTLSGGVGA